MIDLQARIRAEQAGVGRLRHLVSHTASLGALLAVERALTQRQGELESLQQQRAYLADQTSEATITVDVSLRTPHPLPPKAAAGGFVGGLRHGWHGLVTVVGGFLVGLGAFLPFAGAALLLAIPAWPLVRRLPEEDLMNRTVTLSVKGVLIALVVALALVVAYLLGNGGQLGPGRAETSTTTTDVERTPAHAGHDRDRAHQRRSRRAVVLTVGRPACDPTCARPWPTRTPRWTGC